MNLNRNNILSLIQNKCIAIEVGVQDGHYTEILLNHFEIVHAVDPYKHYSSDEYHDGANVEQEYQNKRYSKLKTRFIESDNLLVHRKESIDFLKK